MLADLKNKHILLIVPKFFGYDQLIASRLKSAGAIVTMVYEDMDEVNYRYRFVHAYLPQYMQKVMNRYYLKRVLPISKTLDYVFLIRGEFLSPEVLEKLKRNTPSHCKYYMYQWDSVKNNCNAFRIKDYFDRILTFDPVDAKEYGWIYKPLFYIPELIKKEREDIDVLYLCSLHSKRIVVLNRLKEVCQEKDLKLYKRVYSKLIVFYKQKYFNRKERYRIADNADVSSKKMNLAETYELYGRSRIIVDYTHPGQNGFTMRTIEAFGCGKKLVTNNKNIINADFYDPNNIFVYDGEKVEIPDSFICLPYHLPDKEIYEKYSVDFWLASILAASEFPPIYLG